MSAPQNPAERDSVGKALARTANPAHAASLLRRALVCLRTRGWQALWRETFYRLCLVFGKEPWQLRADVPLRKELRAPKARRPAPAAADQRGGARCITRRPAI